jgi:class 3 adenylate cyclase/tetratricopeptide (TPR) repeat protein
MTCASCRASNLPERRFCAECGAPLAAPCATCGFVNEPSARFCGGCGARWTGTAARSTVSAGDFVAEAAGGERKVVTVLFADLKGSLELLGPRDPEDARLVLDTVLQRLIEAVHAFEGTVNQVLGDGIMALFGAPLAHEDHALRACLSALRMHELVRAEAPDFRERFGVEPLVRVGVNSGDVLMRTMASDVHLDYSAVGVTTHVAARMEQLASPGSTLITADTWRLVRAYVSVRPVAPLEVKGLAEPVEAYELLAASGTRARRGAAVSRLVEREAELERLHHAVARAEQGHGQVVAISGEPGVGKSRLVDEFLAAPALARVRVLQGRALSYGRAVANTPIRELLAEYFAITPADHGPALRDKVEKWLWTLDPVLASLVTPLVGLLEPQGADEAWSRLDPSERRRQSASAFRRLLVRESQSRVLCLVIEDLHWVDPDTRDLLEDLVDFLPALRVLLIVSFRPEYEHAWAAAPGYTEIRLAPLSPPAAATLLDDLLGSDPALEDVGGWLRERTQGNPFFLEESVAHLVDVGVLTGERGARRLARPLDSTHVPATVQGVLAARIDRLSPPQKRLLQCAAVVGRDVPLPVLEAVASVSAEELATDLASLERAAILARVRGSHPPRYRFRHALTYEVAYDLVRRDRRRALHGLVLTVLEGAPSAAEVETLAHHALAAERWRDAVDYCRRAGARALAQAAHRAAAEWFEHALVAIGHLPPEAETKRASIDVRLDMRYALSPRGEFGRMMTYLEEAEQLAGDLGDRRRLGYVSAFMANYFALTGRPNRSIRYASRAFEIAAETGDLSLEVLANAFLAGASYSRGAYRDAVIAAERNVARLGDGLVGERFDLPLFPSVYSRTILASALAELGEFDQATAVGEEAIRIAAVLDHPYSLAYAYLGVGAVHLRRTTFAEGVAVLETALEQSRTAGLVAVSTLASAAFIGCAANAPGHIDRARDVLDRATREASERGDPLAYWLKTAGRAEVTLRAGRAEEALPLAREGVELLRFIRNEGHEGWALLVLADTLAALDAEEAVSAYETVIAHAVARGMRPLEARGRLGLGERYLAVGAVADARVEVEAAGALGDALGMPVVIDRARRARSRLEEEPKVR